jgi:hypothetical protein
MRVRRRLPALLRVFLPIGLLVATCVSTKGPRHGWDEQWGELVSHKTFPADCSLCHVPERWDVLKSDFSFDHEKQTGIALRGAHEEAACLRCHNDFGPVSAYTDRGCGGCHLDPHQAKLGGDCESCHNEENWRPRGLIADHAARGFPLVGAHAVTACEKCHIRAPVGEFRGAPRRCEACHRDDALSAPSMDHAAMGWLSSCERCHIPTTFGAAGFVHGFFPLSGGHAGVACTDCHGSGPIGPISRDCNSCHSDDYQTAPNHVAGSFSTNCEQCHTTQTWQGAVFNHSFFPLTLGHSGLDCSDCHGATPGPRASDCNSCHSDDFASAPDHASLGFPRSCEQCHTTQRWTGAAFSHRFPLRGEHDVSCTVCHDSGSTKVYNCLSCHEHSKSRMDDKHKGRNGYSYDSASCYRCHPRGEGDD